MTSFVLKLIIKYCFVRTRFLPDEICASDVSVTEFSEKWIENQLKASKGDILGRSATKVANPLSYPAKHVNAHHFDPVGLYIHQAILVQPLDDLFFASDAVRWASLILHGAQEICTYIPLRFQASGYRSVR